MLQRIQTIYLLLVSVLFGSSFFIPISKVIVNNEIISLNMQNILVQSSGKSNLIQTLYPSLALAIIVIIIAFTTIFFYKNRKLQMRLITYNTLIIIGLNSLLSYYIYQITIDYNVPFSFSSGFLIPFITIIINILAYRRIKKDDDLIKSIDRIR